MARSVVTADYSSHEGALEGTLQGLWGSMGGVGSAKLLPTNISACVANEDTALL